MTGADEQYKTLQPALGGRKSKDSKVVSMAVAEASTAVTAGGDKLKGRRKSMPGLNKKYETEEMPRVHSADFSGRIPAVLGLLPRQPPGFTRQGASRDLFGTTTRSSKGEKSQVDEWMEMLERTHKNEPPESKGLPAFARKIATAIMLTKSRRPSINTEAETPALAEEAANHGLPLAGVFCRKGMPKRFLAHLRGWSPHQVGSLQSLGLVDDETITNLTRSFRDNVVDDESDQHSEAREPTIQPSLEGTKPVEVCSGADSSLSYNCDAAANAESDYDLTGIVGDEMRARLEAKYKLLRNNWDRDVAPTTHYPQKGRASPLKDTGRSVSPSKESSHAVDDLKPHGSSMFCFLPQVRRGSLRFPNVVKISSSPEHGDALSSSPSKSTSGILLGDNSPLIRGRMKSIVSTNHLQGCCAGQQSEQKTVKDMLFLRKGKAGHGLEVLLVPP